MIGYPFDSLNLLRKKRSIKKELEANKPTLRLRIALLGGSTTAEVRDQLELFLLDNGVAPTFYESDYNKYYEDIFFPGSELLDFRPELILIHTTSRNLEGFPAPGSSEAEVDSAVDAVVTRFESVWDQATTTFQCPIIQNNFELPFFRLVGNQDSVVLEGRVRFVLEINRRFAKAARERTSLYLNDVHYLSSWIGLERWYDQKIWFTSKYAFSLDCIPPFCHNLTSVILAIYGKSKKVIVSDLDNTLWGGVIGDEGVDGIKIGQGNSEAEAFTEMQEYLLVMRSRGILLAVDSKNDLENAKAGFQHEASVLKLADFSSVQANWEPKSENMKVISGELSLGLDSFVFVDDNPSERELVRQQLPEVAVPEIGADVTSYVSVLDKSGLFEGLRLSSEDLQRSAFYSQNQSRAEAKNSFLDYGQYLDSLEMTAYIGPVDKSNLDRVTQLINKTNQFNFTTKRLSLSEVLQIAESRHHVALYGRLVDKFGDNGIVSVVIGEAVGEGLDISVWLMSCRVLKRDLELAMLDALVHRAKDMGLTMIRGRYIPTAKNKMVSSLFETWGFSRSGVDQDGLALWVLPITELAERNNKHIEVVYG